MEEVVKILVEITNKIRTCLISHSNSTRDSRGEAVEATREVSIKEEASTNLEEAIIAVDTKEVVLKGTKPINTCLKVNRWVVEVVLYSPDTPLIQDQPLFLLTAKK